MIIYKCPKCGSKVIEMVLPTYPPKRKFECSNPECDYLHIEREGLIIREAPMKKEMGNED